MLITVKDKTIISTVFNNEIIDLLESDIWSLWMKDTQNFSNNTIASYLASMDRFWLWSLYNPVELDESFPSYLSKYRKALLSGYEITAKLENSEGFFNDPVECVVAYSNKKTKATINKELAGITSYFVFMEEDDLIYNNKYINHLYEKQLSSRGFLAGIQIRKSDTALDAFGKKRAHIRPYKTTRTKVRQKYFPKDLFDELLELSKPREQLIYILCGITSARIGQALNLTMYDLDYDKKEVWLLDPRMDYKDIYGNRRNRWLKEEYSIDAEDEESDHGKPDLQFKYPIPLYHNPMYWLFEDKYVPMFFDLLTKYRESKTFLSEHARSPRHPFLFVRRSGKRVHSREVLNRFQNTANKLRLRYPHRKKDLTGLGLHSLRHMFGNAMAEMYADTGDEMLPVVTMEAMGHSSFESTMEYFKVSEKKVRAILKKHTRNVFEKKPLGEKDEH